jgi:hypothetical protein
MSELSLEASNYKDLGLFVNPNWEKRGFSWEKEEKWAEKCIKPIFTQTCLGRLISSLDTAKWNVHPDSRAALSGHQNVPSGGAWKSELSGQAI